MAPLAGALVAALVALTLGGLHPVGCEPAFIKVTKFAVPSKLRQGDSARLTCLYELSKNETLHAMKLFKDDHEFYRFTPMARQPDDRKLAFQLAGVQLDLAKSGETDAYLVNASELTAGLFKCQVSVEATFRSVSVERRLEVPPAGRLIGTGSGQPGGPRHRQQHQHQQHQQHQHQQQHQNHQQRHTTVQQRPAHLAGEPGQPGQPSAATSSRPGESGGLASLVLPATLLASLIKVLALLA